MKSGAVSVLLSAHKPHYPLVRSVLACIVYHRVTLDNTTRWRQCDTQFQTLHKTRLVLKFFLIVNRSREKTKINYVLLHQTLNRSI